MRPAALVISVVALVAACSSPSPSTPPPTTPPVATPADEQTPRPTAMPPAPTVSPVATPAATPAPTMTPDEAALLDKLRVDAATDCAPRRADLPDGARYGIECRPDDAQVARVGIYWFASPNEAVQAYLTRMASYGVDPNEGDCNRGIPGDTAWTPGDGEGNIDDPGVFNWENAVLSPNRDGCFSDENGTANVRATCGNAYIGVLGRGTDLAALHDWTWRYPEGYEPGTPDSPGICIGPR